MEMKSLKKLLSRLEQQAARPEGLNSTKGMKGM